MRRGFPAQAAVAAIVLLLGILAVPRPAAGATAEVTLVGRGWGHGRGMGQYGALGYAKDKGWTADQILNHFYGQTTAGTLPPSNKIRVALSSTGDSELVVTSGADFSIGGVVIAAGSAGRLVREGTGWRLHTAYSCTSGWVWSTPVADPTFVSSVASPGDDHASMLRLCTGSGNTYRGTIGAVANGAALTAINTVTIEEYVQGVLPAEIPVSWHIEAVKAQAVAARSYGWARSAQGTNPICDTISCQVYRGVRTSTTVYESGRGNQAVAQTAGQVRMRGGSVISTEFSSSTGGHTAGGVFPAVSDEGDSVSDNPNHRWTTTINGQALADRYGLGSFVEIEVLERNGLGEWGGRVLRVRVRGTSGSRDLTGDQFRGAAGIRSDWFAVTNAPPRLFLTNDNRSGVAQFDFAFGSPGDHVLMCDFDGDGVDAPVTYRDGVWQFRNANSAGAPAGAFAFGAPGDVPFCGRWNGGRADGPGVFRRGVIYLRNTPTNGPVDIMLGFGNPGDHPVAGDWDGDGVDGLAVTRNGTWYVKNRIDANGVADGQFGYGNPGDLPVAGDWDGDGVDGPGVFRAGTWFLRQRATTGVADLAPFGYGNPNDRPVAGDFNGDGRDSVGIARGH